MSSSQTPTPKNGTASSLGTASPSLPPLPSSRSSQRPRHAYRLSSYNPSQLTRKRRQSQLAQDVPTPPTNSADDPELGSEDQIEDADWLGEVITAIDVRNNKTVGCCFYVAKDEKLFVSGDMKLGGLEVVEAFKNYTQPTALLLPSRIHEAIEALLDPENSTGDASERPSVFQDAHVLEMRPSHEFSYESGQSQLEDLQHAIEEESLRALSESTRSPTDGSVAAQTAAMDRIAIISPGDDEAEHDSVTGLDPGLSARKGRTLRLSAVVDMDSKVSVGCAGAVLTYLQRRRAGQYLPRDGEAAAPFRISSIEFFSLDNVMYLSPETLIALQIVQAESHPNSHNQGPTSGSSGSKEGLSVYGLFHHLARTPQGKHLLRQYFLRPSLDLDTITARHAAVSIFLRSDNAAPVENMIKSLKSIKNMKPVMMHLRKGMSNGASKSGISNGVWSSLRSFTYYALSIRNAIREISHADHLDIRTKLIENFEGQQVASVGRDITQIVDFPASNLEHRTVVQHGVDEDLDGLKHTYDGLDDLLNKAAKNIGNSIRDPGEVHLEVKYIPQVGFLIAIPIDPVTRRPRYDGSEDGEPWRRIFSTNEQIMFKDFRMDELDETIGDLHGNICGREIEIVHDLAQRVLQYEGTLCFISDILAELDCLLALAQGAKLYKLTKPRMTTRNIIQIQAGRHVLQDQTAEAFVANSASLAGGPGTQDTSLALPTEPTHNEHVERAEDAPSVFLMTGPNQSGKSVYLKQTALIVYMAHVGSFVPAEKATIGITDKILTRIATRETVSSIHSTFATDLKQVSSALRLATRRSLVILDEFGKGTEASNGAGLFCGVVERLLGLGDDRPKVLCATHFHEIFDSGFLRPEPHLAFGHMEVRDNQSVSTEDRVIPLFNLKPGRSGSSFGIACAAMNGIDGSVIARAEELLALQAGAGDLLSACAQLNAQEVKDRENAESLVRAFLAIEFEQPSVDPAFDAREALRQITT